MKDSKSIARTNGISLNYLFELVQKNIVFFLSFLLTCMLIAFIINKYTSPTYIISSSIVIRQNESNFSTASTQLLQGIGFTTVNKNFANELQTLKSSPLIMESLKKLDFTISYYQFSGFINHELYKNSPFVVIINKNHPQPINTVFKINIESDGTFKLASSGKDVALFSFVSNEVAQIIPKLDVNEVGTFDKSLTCDSYDFKIVLNQNFNLEDYKSTNFSFRINSPTDLLAFYQKALSVESPEYESTVAQISVNSQVPIKDVDFINSLAESYISKDLEQKNYLSIRTIEYIDNQLNIVKDSLSIAENRLQTYRSSNRVVDLSLQSGKILDEVTEIEKEKSALMIKKKYYQYISEYFVANQEYSDLITPAGMGIEDPLLNNMIEELIKLNAEKVTLIENNQQKSPYLKKIQIRIDNLKNTIVENISYVMNTTDMSINDIDSRLRQLNREISKVPETEKELLGIQRKFNLNDAIYTFLLQRRAEAEIAKASYLSDIEVLEPASHNNIQPVSPNKKLNCFIAFLMGIFMPLVILRIKDITNNTFSEKSEIDDISVFPVLGKVYKNNKNVEAVVNTFPKSHIAESFRMLRSNINYFIAPGKGRTIAVTSLISQEGKSFISLNLAISLAMTHQKTILLGFDLRKPKKYERIGIKEKEGLSSYLSNQAEISDILQKTDIENLDIIIAGEIPPNPTTLITSARVDQLLSKLKEEYNYIVIDSAPIGLVSDSYELLQKSDLKILVVRLNHTPKQELLDLVNEMKNNNHNNVCIITNDVPMLKSHKNGYGYYDDQSN